MPETGVAVRNEDSLTVEYALTRRENLLAFFRCLAQSPKFRRTILLYAIAATFVPLVVCAPIWRSFTWIDGLVALVYLAAFIPLLSLGVAIRGKSAKRTLTVSSGGIWTEIGRRKAQIPWAKIKSVSDASTFVAIACTNGNAFFIPNRAFSSPDQRHEFLAKVTAWTTKPT